MTAPTTRPRRATVACALAAALATAACTAVTPTSDASAAAQLAAGGDSLPVALVGTVRPLRGDERPDRLSAAGGSGQVEVGWEVRSGPCMLATADARRAGAEIIVRVRRGGDPVALCVAGEVVYRYAITVRSIPAGEYRVRLVEQPVEQSAREVGVATVVVRAPGT